MGIDGEFGNTQNILEGLNVSSSKKKKITIVTIFRLFCDKQCVEVFCDKLKYIKSKK